MNSDPYAYIRDHYGLSCKAGDLVEVECEGVESLKGVVVNPLRNSTAHVRVRPLGEKHTIYVHPDDVTVLETRS